MIRNLIFVAIVACAPLSCVPKHAERSRALASRDRWGEYLVIQSAIVRTDSLPGGIRGTVRDFATLAPLEGVQVFLCGASVFAVTDSTGRFNLSAARSHVAPEAPRAICFQRIGYQRARSPGTFVADHGWVIETVLPRRAIVIVY